MLYVYVRHEVQDFAAWKVAFDAHAEAQRAAGLRDPRLFRDAEKPNVVVILFQATDEAKAKAFVASADLRDTMMRAGVVGMPDVHFLNTAG